MREALRRGARVPGRRLSYANVTATLALVIALGGGTAWAAHTYLITSTSQIKPSVLKKLRGPADRRAVQDQPGRRVRPARRAFRERRGRPGRLDRS